MKCGYHFQPACGYSLRRAVQVLAIIGGVSVFEGVRAYNAYA